MPKVLKLRIEDLEQRIAPGIVLTTGLLSPQGSHDVSAPDAASGGAQTAFTNIVTKGPGDIANLSISFVC